MAVSAVGLSAELRVGSLENLSVDVRDAAREITAALAAMKLPLPADT